jgi:acyl-CoA thioester hydrolase
MKNKLYFCKKKKPMTEKFNKTDFNHSIPIQIRFSDLDALNHVNNGFQCQYFDVGRIHYFRDALKRDIDWSKEFVVLVHIDIDFLSPIMEKDKIFVESKLIEFGKKSMKMYQRIIDKENNIIKSTCYGILSGFDRDKNCSIPIPDEFKQAFIDYEHLSLARQAI